MSKKQAQKKLTEALKEQIRIEFVQGIQDEEGNREYPTIETLQKKFSVAKSTLYRVCQNNAWKTERERFQRELLAKVDKDRIKNLAEENKKIDQTSIDLAKAMFATVGQGLRKNMQDINEGKLGLSATHLHALANTALTAQKIAKLALGETTENVNLNANFHEADAFREAMELRDSVAEQRREADDSPVH